MIKTLFWISVGLVGSVYLLYPMAISVFSKIFGKSPLTQDIEPFTSLIIPMHNEERVARKKLENTLNLDYPKDRLEIIFALDGCADGTKKILSECKDPRITIIESRARGGKVAVLNRVVPLAKGRIIVFSDANSMHREDALKKIVRNFADKKVGCVSGKLVYLEADSNSIGRGENLYWKYEGFLKRQESKLGRLLVTNGSIQAVRKELYPYPDPEIADDFSIPLLIQAKGYKVLNEPEAVVYEKATQSLKEEFAQKVRIISQGIKGAVRMRRDLLRLGPIGLFELFFHKVLRWCIPLFLIVIFFTNLLLVNNVFYFSLFAAQIVFYILAFTGFILRNQSKVKVFYVPFYLCLVNFASLAAFYRFFRKGETHIWDKAYSTRNIR